MSAFIRMPAADAGHAASGDLAADDPWQRLDTQNGDVPDFDGGMDSGSFDV